MSCQPKDGSKVIEIRLCLGIRKVCFHEVVKGNWYHLVSHGVNGCQMVWYQSVMLRYKEIRNPDKYQRQEATLSIAEMANHRLRMSFTGALGCCYCAGVASNWSREEKSDGAEERRRGTERKRTEICLHLKSVRQFDGDGHLWCVFRPSQFSNGTREATVKGMKWQYGHMPVSLMKGVNSSGNSYLTPVHHSNLIGFHLKSPLAICSCSRFSAGADVYIVLIASAVSVGSCSCRCGCRCGSHLDDGMLQRLLTSWCFLPAIIGCLRLCSWYFYSSWSLVIYDCIAYLFFFYLNNHKFLFMVSYQSKARKGSHLVGRLSLSQFWLHLNRSLACSLTAFRWTLADSCWLSMARCLFQMFFSAITCRKVSHSPAEHHAVFGLSPRLTRPLSLLELLNCCLSQILHFYPFFCLPD